MGDFDASLAGKIDHTLLKPGATADEIAQLCKEARTYEFATVCVRPEWVKLASDLLQGSRTRPISVVGFPTGEAASKEKVRETEQAVRDGAAEIDMVVALPALRKCDYGAVFRDIQAVVAASAGKPVKVILETAALTPEQKISGAALAAAAGAAFVKTSTGFGPGGATVEDVALLRRVVGPNLGVKASGGIRTREDALKMIDAGATRVGASSSVAIVTSGSTSGTNGY